MSTRKLHNASKTEMSSHWNSVTKPPPKTQPVGIIEKHTRGMISCAEGIVFRLILLRWQRAAGRDLWDIVTIGSCIFSHYNNLWASRSSIRFCLCPPLVGSPARRRIQFSARFKTMMLAESRWMPHVVVDLAIVFFFSWQQEGGKCHGFVEKIKLVIKFRGHSYSRCERW